MEGSCSIVTADWVTEKDDFTACYFGENVHKDHSR